MRLAAAVFDISPSLTRIHMTKVTPGAAGAADAPPAFHPMLRPCLPMGHQLVFGRQDLLQATCVVAPGQSIHDAMRCW